MTVDVLSVLPVHSIDYRTQSLNLKPPAGVSDWTIAVPAEYQALASEVIIFNRSADVLQFYDEVGITGTPMPLESHTMSQLEGWFDFIHIVGPNPFADLTVRMTFAKLAEIRTVNPVG